MKQDELNALVRALYDAGTPDKTIGDILKGLLADVDVTATRGGRSTVTMTGARPSRLPPEERIEMARRMGTTEYVEGCERKIHWERNARVFPVISKAEARRVLERHGVDVRGPR